MAAKTCAADLLPGRLQSAARTGDFEDAIAVGAQAAFTRLRDRGKRADRPGNRPLRLRAKKRAAA
jgi:hypothetical protein